MSRAFALLMVSLVTSSRLWADYDPLLMADAKTEQVDLGVKDAKRSREIPIRVYLPADKKAAPVVLFSHGLGGNREGSAFLGKHWASRGYAAVFLQHPGSDDSGPANGNTKRAFGSVKIPWMLLTGTKDSNPINGADAKTRLIVFPDVPLGSKYQLVLDNAEHSAFTERALPGETERRNPNHHRATLAVTTAFWDAYLRQDKEARQWLDSDAVRSVLEKDGQWQKK